jgi:hypothetical protein
MRNLHLCISGCRQTPGKQNSLTASATAFNVASPPSSQGHQLRASPCSKVLTRPYINNPSLKVKTPGISHKRFWSIPEEHAGGSQSQIRQHTGRLAGAAITP